MEGLIFSEDLCRLCLWKSNKLLPIFGEEGEMQGIPLKIGLCLPISVLREDCLPKLICSQCIYKLEMFSEFRNSCVRSEQLLKRYTSHEMQLPPPPPSGSIPTIQSCHTLVMQMQDEMKIEIHEPDPITTEQDVPFMCLIPEEQQKESIQEGIPQTFHTMMPAELNSCSPETEQKTVNTLSVLESKDQSVKSLLKQEILDVGRTRRVMRRNRALKKQRNNAEPVTHGMIRIKLGPRKQKGSRNVPHLSALGSSGRRLHRCKHCSKNFSTRVQLSRHLTSSDCLFRCTCRYCAKICNNAENRIYHERNHIDKRNFICRICKYKFSSSFDLNVHTVQGCESQMVKNSQEVTPTIFEQQMVKNLQEMTPTITEVRKKRDFESNQNEMNEPNQTVITPAESSVVKITPHMKCKLCNKNFSHIIPYKRHIRSCRRSTHMKKVHEIRRKNAQIRRTQKLVAMQLNQDNLLGDNMTHKMTKVFPEEIRIRTPSRRKQNLINSQNFAILENSTTKPLPEISPKASLLAVLGLKEKPKPVETKPAQKSEELKNCKINIDSKNEVVTVCDICRKIFTSESGMLNHQITVHNRNLTAEKINSLMRVEI